MPKRKTGGRSTAKPSQPIKRKASSTPGSSSLSPVKSALPSPAPTSNSNHRNGFSGSLTGSNDTPGAVIDEGALQAITGDIEDDVELQLQMDTELAVPDMNEGGELDLDVDQMMADELMAHIASDQMMEDLGNDMLAAPTEEELADQEEDDLAHAEEDEDEDEEAGDEDDDEDEEDDDDDEEDDGEEGEENDSNMAGPSNGSTTALYRYPTPPSNFLTLSEREKAFKIARFIPCQSRDCSCLEMIPPAGVEPAIMSRVELEEIMDRDEEDEGDESRTGEGWWRVCGSCGHSWDEEGVGHTWPAGVSLDERNRRGKVVGRIEELLNDHELLTIFPTPRISDTESLYKQLLPFHRPTGGKTGGKKPALPVGPAIDISTPDSHSTPNIGSDQEEDRPLKRRRMSEGEEDVTMDGGEEVDESVSAKKGKKPSGKTTGRKERMPRTVVRSARGLVPMETEADGTQHIGGQLPDTVLQDGAAVVASAEGDGEEEEVPLAQQRPQLDEGERKRREIAKEKEKEREVEVLRNQRREDVEIWEGVELPKLPPRPAAVEEAADEIRLMVVASRNPTPTASILLIGLKNLFQKQLPKMPREYITRLVLDKNHISMAIVKKGWRVVGGICYRPFESRGFAEIVFCAVDSSEQIKGYGSHLMNSLKDHVKRSHLSINYFLTYADNYAVGYFKKQGFTKEISFPREKWVGYIKDYEGGTIMQCGMLPKVRYLEVHQMLADQKAAVLAKIKSLTKSHVVHRGLDIFRDRKEGVPFKLKKEEVPGLAETSWDPDLDDILRQPTRNPHHGLLQQVLDDLLNEPSAWPFLKPVDAALVHDYYNVITHPIDLSTMESKLENNHYDTIESFMDDVKLMCANCRQYNGDKNTYTSQANKLEKAAERILKKRQAATV